MRLLQLFVKTTVQKQRGLPERVGGDMATGGVRRCTPGPRPVRYSCFTASWVALLTMIVPWRLARPKAAFKHDHQGACKSCAMLVLAPPPVKIVSLFATPDQSAAEMPQPGPPRSRRSLATKCVPFSTWFWETRTAFQDKVAVSPARQWTAALNSSAR